MKKHYKKIFIYLSALAIFLSLVPPGYSAFLNSDSTHIGYGDIVAGSIGILGEIDVYTFDGTPGDLLTIRVKPSGTFDSRLVLYTPGDSLLASSDVSYGSLNTFENIVLPDSGLYTFSFSEIQGDEVCSYWLSLQSRQNMIANADTIFHDQGVQDSIYPNVEIDAYVFAGTIGDIVTIRMKPSGGFDSRVELIAPGDSLLAATNMEAGGMNGFANLALPVSGTYAIVISETQGDETCSYSLFFQSRQYMIANSDTILYDMSVQDSISPNVDIDAYVFLGAAGDVITIRMKPSGSFDSRLELIAPGDSLLATGDIAHGNLNAFNDLVLPDSGLYAIFVSEIQGDETCNYWLTLQCRQHLIANADSIFYDTVVQDSIAPTVDMDAYVFAGTAGDVITIRMKPSADFDSRLELIAPGDSVLATSHVSFGELNSIQNIALPDSGLYIIFISEIEGDEACHYWLSLQSRLQIIADADTLFQPQGTIVRSLEDYGDIKAYIFLVSKFDETNVKMTQNLGNIDPRMELYGPDDSLIVGVHHFYEAEIVDSFFTDSGLYILFVSNHEADPGSYQLSWSGFATGMIQVSSLLAPSGIVPLGPSIIPQAVVRNIGWQGESYTARFRIYTYSDSLEGLSLLPGQSDTLSFSSWETSEAAAYITRCATQLVGSQTRFEKTGVVSVSKGTGPEIYGRSPDNSANSGFVPVNITGSRFEDGITARLKHIGQPDVVADSSAVQFISSEEMIATFNLRDAKGAIQGNWDLEVMNPNGAAYTLYEGFTVREFAGQEISFGSWEPFRVEDGLSLQADVNVPVGVDDLFVLVKKITPSGYAGTWSGSMRLFREGGEVASVSGNDDFDVHIQNPEYGWYTLKIESSDPGDGFIKACASLDALPLGQWKRGEVLRPYGSDWMQVDVPAGQAALHLQTEGLGLWSTLDVSHGYLGNPDQHWRFSNMGTGYHIEGKITNPDAGKYYLRYTDSAVLPGSGGQTREYLIIADTDSISTPPPSEPVVTGLSTYKGGTSEPVTVIIWGSGLHPSATVFLARDGYADVMATYVVGDSLQRQLTATFDLSPAEPGNWILTVTNPDAQSAVAPDPFVVEADGEPDVWVEIVGRETMQVGRAQTYVIRYGNAGGVDAWGAWLLFTVPQGLSWSFLLEGTEYSGTADSEPGELITVAVTHLPVGSEHALPLTLTAPGPHDSLRIRADFTLHPSQYFTLRGRARQYPGLEKTAPHNRTLQYRHRISSGQTPPTLEYPPYLAPWEQRPPGYMDDFTCCGPESCFQQTGISLGEGRIGWSFPGVGVEEASFSQLNNPSDPTYGAYTFYHHGSWRPTEDWADPQANNVESEFQQHLGRPFDPNSEHGGISCSGLYEEVIFRGIWGWNEDELYNAMDKNPKDNYLRTDELQSYIWKENHLTCQIERMGMPISGLLQWPITHLTKLFRAILSPSAEDKCGPSGYDAPDTPLGTLKKYVSAETQLSYRIDFWNADTATFPVQDVFIVDTLATTFLSSSLAFTEFGFLRWTIPLMGGQYFDIDVDMRPDTNVIVNVEGKYDQDSREISWTFRSLDPETGEPLVDPTEGFLPPITQSGYEIAWVDFSVRPQPDLPSGTTIANQAYVNFDGIGLWNPAPFEAPYRNTIDAVPPESKIEPLAPFMNRITFNLHWSGEDDSLGSGIRDYIIYVSDNGAPYAACCQTTDTTITFAGEPSHHYRFYSMATDNVSNKESAPAEPDAETTTTGVEVMSEAHLPTAFALSQNYPNPFNPKTTIKYQLPKDCQVTLTIYNILGQKVRTLVNEWQRAGYYAVQWDGKNDRGAEIASGVYFYRIKADQFTSLKKSVHLK